MFINNAEVYLFSDQPATCPICGSRTDIIFEEQCSIEKKQVHECLNSSCKYEFVLEEDIYVK
jgi:hypothetical protein